mgnify:CR=1 FL=1
MKDLDPQKPTAATLLGVPMVMWKDGSGSWNCFEDRCPHRWVELWQAFSTDVDAKLLLAGRTAGAVVAGAGVLVLGLTGFFTSRSFVPADRSRP